MSGKGDQILFDAETAGLQRLGARFRGHAYDQHRHETYGIGVTDWGTQCFHYRGMLRGSQQRQVIVLHPDEIHDGHSGSENGFAYRMIYVDPALIAAALPRGGGLPFVPDVVGYDAEIAGLLDRAFEDFQRPLDALATDSLIASLAAALRRRSDDPGEAKTGPLARPRVARARALFDDAPERDIGSAELERLTGLTRFELARQFRQAYGTSPHRYLLGRRLARAQGLILEGEPLAEVAAASGFADQSHLTRHFRARFGVTPGRWAKLVGDRNMRNLASV